MILLASFLLLGILEDGLPPTLQFTLDRPATAVHYQLTLHPDGTGSYHTTYPPVPPATPGETVDIPLQLHPATAAALFEQARSTNGFRGGCETHAKNIAQTGAKTLLYTPATGPSSTCTWNYSDKVTIQAMQDQFLALATTLDLGRTLRLKQRYDRLALDREMTVLVDAVKDGRARGIENIAPTLEAIVADESLLERVRSRASRLLEQSQLDR